MGTFTLSTNAKATISVDRRRRTHKINANVYGGFTEYCSNRPAMLADR
jgi:hypothetical protein